MKLYKIPVSWTVIATMEIYAKSLDEALELAQHEKLPTDNDYLEDSFQIETDGLEDWHL